MLHNSNKEKAVKLDMNLKNHFAGDVCAAVKSREVGKDRAGARSGGRYECGGNEFRSSYLLKTKTRERE